MTVWPSKSVSVPCPKVITEYKGKMGGIGKSNVLTHLLPDPHACKIVLYELFGYASHLCITNVWIIYKRNCSFLKEKPMPVKFIWLDISQWALCQKMTNIRHVTRALPQKPPPLSCWGHMTQTPPSQLQYDVSKQHMPILVTNRQTCKHCSTKKEVQDGCAMFAK